MTLDVAGPRADATFSGSFEPSLREPSTYIPPPKTASNARAPTIHFMFTRDVRSMPERPQSVAVRRVLGSVNGIGEGCVASPLSGGVPLGVIAPLLPGGPEGVEWL